MATSRGLTMMAETKAAPAAESARSNIPSSRSAPAAGTGPEDEDVDGEDDPWCDGETAPPVRSTREAAAVIQVGSEEPLEQPAMAYGNPSPGRSGRCAARVAVRLQLESLPPSSLSL